MQAPPPPTLTEPPAVAHVLPFTPIIPHALAYPLPETGHRQPGVPQPRTARTGRTDHLKTSSQWPGSACPAATPSGSTRPLTATTLKKALGGSGERGPCVRTRGCHPSLQRCPAAPQGARPTASRAHPCPRAAGRRGPLQNPPSSAERPAPVRISCLPELPRLPADLGCAANRPHGLSSRDEVGQRPPGRSDSKLMKKP